MLKTFCDLVELACRVGGSASGGRSWKERVDVIQEGFLRDAGELQLMNMQCAVY